MVVERIDKIENNVNSRLLICKGPVVAEKIKSFTRGKSTDFDKIKAHLCKSICGSKIPRISVDSFELSIFGKERKSLKFECNAISVKNYLLKQARLNKPSGIYLAEYLSADKRKVYSKLVGLKKEYSSIFKALYTRDGEIFGKIGRATLKFRNLKDVESINYRDSEPSASRSSIRPLIPEEARLPVDQDECGAAACQD